MTACLLALDAGTTSGRAIVFSPEGQVVASAHRPLRQSYPHSGWVEQDPGELWTSVNQSAREALQRAGLKASQILAVGITNQRETTIIWDRWSGQPIYPAIVWQDRRTADQCEALRDRGLEDTVRRRSGLLLDPYFSAGKIAWILDQVPGARRRAERGELCFGTVDTWLVWRLTAGRRHITDATNAARTSLFNIGRQRWDDTLLELFNVPAALLPEVLDSAQDELKTDVGWLGAPLPVCGIAGDQQAAMVGQACVRPGMMKVTYGTGGFLMLNTGDEPVLSGQNLLTTVGYRIGGKVSYALEGSIFNVGTAIQWLRDQLRQFDDPAQTAALAAQAQKDSEVMLVPAFTGLGAPHWDPQARGLICGLTRNSGTPELVKAALESAVFQTRDLTDAMRADGQMARTLRVDGGMAANDWLCQRLADGLQLPVDRPAVTETTAWGAAVLAMLGKGELGHPDEARQLWQCRRRFSPALSAEQASADYARWRQAVARTRLSA